MTDNAIIAEIHDSDLRPVWNGLPREAKEQILKEADGDTWRLDSIVYEVAEDYRRNTNDTQGVEQKYAAA